MHLKHDQFQLRHHYKRQRSQLVQRVAENSSGWIAVIHRDLPRRAQFAHHLAACQARHSVGTVIRCRDGDRGELPAPFRHHLEEGHALCADGHPVTGVLHVTSRIYGAVLSHHRRANAVPGIRAVGVLSGFQRLINKQISVLVHFCTSSRRPRKRFSLQMLKSISQPCPVFVSPRLTRPLIPVSCFSAFISLFFP